MVAFKLLSLQEADDQRRHVVVPHDVRVLLRHRHKVRLYVGRQVRQPRLRYRHRPIARPCTGVAGTSGSDDACLS